MAVIQISRLQVRRGLQENLPQLASAELGWSIDQRRLFIGNGTISEGAPIPGNTEILTQYTDIANVLSSVVFKGDESGYLSQTASSAAAQINRTLQHKLDEQISLRDFGGVGDGSTDNTAALQRALFQLVPISYYNASSVRRILHIPAGVYVISGTISIPSYISIVGDGIDATVIQQIGTSAVFTFVDSKQQTGVAFGSNSSLPPNTINISGLTLQNTTDNDVVQIDSASNVRFENVKFLGQNATPTTAGNAMAGVRIANSIAPVNNILFDKCVFTQTAYGLYATGNVTQLLVNESTFNYLYQGAVLTTMSALAPSAVSFVGNQITNIANYGFNINSGASAISTANSFVNVGNGLQGPNNPLVAAIYFEGSNNFVFGNMFDRDPSATIPVVTSNATIAQSIYSTNVMGSLNQSSGHSTILADNTTLANTGAYLSSTTSNAIIDYTVFRNNASRTGTIKLSQYNGSSVFEDDYSETGPVGIKFSFATVGTKTVMQYNSSALGVNATFKYQIRNFS